MKGLLPAAGIVGVFADTGLFQRPVECSADSTGIIGAGGQRIESFLTAGVSLRFVLVKSEYNCDELLWLHDFLYVIVCFLYYAEYWGFEWTMVHKYCTRRSRRWQHHKFISALIWVTNYKVCTLEYYIKYMCYNEFILVAVQVYCILIHFR